MNDNTMTHGADCSRPPPNSKRVNAGWMRLTCSECAHVGSAAAPAPVGVAYVAPVRNLTPEPEPRPTVSGYRCREHLEQSVTWRGTGCTRCAADLKARNAPKVRDDYERVTYR